MNRLVMGALAILIALVAALGSLSYHQQGQLAVTADALKRAQSDAIRSDRASVQAAQEKAATAREMALLRQRLDAVLDANRPWADQPVPKEVQDALDK
jgi:hypothetical protein